MTNLAICPLNMNMQRMLILANMQQLQIEANAVL